MTTALTLACLWVLAAAATAMLPMRRQYVPGIALLVVAPVLLVFVAKAHGLWVTVACVVALLSMFRNPLIYFARRAMGLPVSLPEELERDR
ncbi:DUF2484 family protein [Maribius pontilimi]|uniref:DUF2484 family protein n=1 Tax=Palleronia pontilimi TaxID=1964209 RepID=A0A934MDD7_9RHOB|nr:DUF2484 family protein [Palleronia pontilimi]MBJ3762256.1 DUF2484 family protein [Palleronia pontilimi]